MEGEADGDGGDVYVGGELDDLVGGGEAEEGEGGTGGEVGEKAEEVSVLC